MRISLYCPDSIYHRCVFSLTFTTTSSRYFGIVISKFICTKRRLPFDPSLPSGRRWYTFLLFGRNLTGQLIDALKDTSTLIFHSFAILSEPRDNPSTNLIANRAFTLLQMSFYYATLKVHIPANCRIVCHLSEETSMPNQHTMLIQFQTLSQKIRIIQPISIRIPLAL